MPRAMTATSRAASRSRATRPTSHGARRSGSSPRTAAGGRSRRRVGPARARVPARASTTSTASCTSTTSTRWTSSSPVGRGDDEEGVADDGTSRRKASRVAAGKPASQGARARVTPASAPGRAADRARTAFFGSGAFAVPILDAVAGHPRSTSSPSCPRLTDLPAGAPRRPPRPWPLGRERGLPLVQPARVRAPEAVAELAALEPDLGVLADYGQIVPRPPRPAAPRDPQRPPVAPAAAPRRDADPGDDRGGRRPRGRDDHPDGRRHRHRPDRRPGGWPLDGTEPAPELEARGGARGRRAARPDDRSVARRRDRSRRPRATARRSRGRSGADDGRLDPGRPALELERRSGRTPWPGTFLETPPAGWSSTRHRSAPRNWRATSPGALVRHE